MNFILSFHSNPNAGRSLQQNGLVRKPGIQSNYLADTLGIEKGAPRVGVAWGRRRRLNLRQRKTKHDGNLPPSLPFSLARSDEKESTSSSLRHSAKTWPRGRSPQNSREGGPVTPPWSMLLFRVYHCLLPFKLSSPEPAQFHLLSVDSLQFPFDFRVTTLSIPYIDRLLNPWYPFFFFGLGFPSPLSW